MTRRYRVVVYDMGSPRLSAGQIVETKPGELLQLLPTPETVLDVQVEVSGQTKLNPRDPGDQADVRDIPLQGQIRAALEQARPSLT